MAAILRMQATHMGSGKDLSAWSDDWDCDEWRCELTIIDDAGTRVVRVPFYTGAGHRRQVAWNATRSGDRAPVPLEDVPHGYGTYLAATPPTLGDVLECLSSDATMTMEFGGWGDWALNMLDVGNLSAAELESLPVRWDAMRQDTARFVKFLGASADRVFYDGPEDGWSSVDDETIAIGEED